jgi:hypothetical protein
MPKRIAQDWEELERELPAAGVSPEEIESGALALLARVRADQLAGGRKQLGVPSGISRQRWESALPTFRRSSTTSSVVCRDRPIR